MANEGLQESPTKNTTILVVTVTGRGQHPMYTTCVFFSHQLRNPSTTGRSRLKKNAPAPEIKTQKSSMSSLTLDELPCNIGGAIRGARDDS